MDFSSVLILVLPILHTQSILAINVSGNCSRNFPPEQFEVTGTKRPSLSCTLYGTESCRNGSLSPQFEGPSAGPPSSLDVAGLLVMDPNGDLSPQLIVEWRAPDNDLIHNLIGFLVEIRKYDVRCGDSTYVCRIFDLSNESLKSSDRKLRFKKKFVGFPGGSGYNYRVDIYSLPYSPGHDGVTKNFNLQPFINGSVVTAADWSPFLSYDEVNFTEPANVTVTFGLAEKKYNFSHYSVLLMSVTDELNPAQKCQVSTESRYVCQNRVLEPPLINASTFTMSFVDVPSGSYYIKVQPVDPYHSNDGRCLCRRKGSGVCSGCMETSTAKFTVSSSVGHQSTDIDKGIMNTHMNMTTQSTQYTRDDGVGDNVVIIAVTVCGFGITLIIALTLICCWKKGNICKLESCCNNVGPDSSNCWSFLQLRRITEKGTQIVSYHWHEMTKYDKK